LFAATIEYLLSCQNLEGIHTLSQTAGLNPAPHSNQLYDANRARKWLPLPAGSFRQFAARHRLTGACDEESRALTDGSRDDLEA
jgi:hypothetical protein